MVEFPHWPFGETIRVPEGSGGDTEDAELVASDEDDGLTGVEEEDGVGVGVGVGVEEGTTADDEVTGGALPHLPKSGWHPTISPQNSNSLPQYPYWEQH